MQCHTDHRGYGKVHMVSISKESSHAGGYFCLTPGTRMHANKPFVAQGPLYCIRICASQESAPRPSLIFSEILLTFRKIPPANIFKPLNQ